MEHDEQSHSPELAADDTAARPSLPPHLEEAVEAWFARHFHGLGPMLDTPLYNLMHAAKEDLRRVLAALSL